jgi:hypothetical protein
MGVGGLGEWYMRNDHKEGMEGIERGYIRGHVGEREAKIHSRVSLFLGGREYL